MEKAVTIGTFDGVHRGHKLVLDTLKNEAVKHGFAPYAMTFDRHPLDLIAPGKAPGNLMSTSRKAELIRREGVEPIVLPFNEKLRSMRAFDWLDYIHRKYDVSLLVAGYDNTFGCDGIDMTIADYKAMGATVGIEVISAPEVDGISSSAIRKAEKRGDIKTATEMLGHYPELEGKVMPGFHVGHELGFPTANLNVSPTAVIPAVGVYATKAFIDSQSEYAPAMVNIGNRPTFDGTSAASGQISVEAHIIGLDDDLYGKNIRLEFVERLRDEKKFDSLLDLRQQLNSDREDVLSIIRRGV